MPASRKHHHIVQEYDKELAVLKSKLSEMGGLVESQMQKVLRVLSERDCELAEEICAADSAVDAMESEIDSMCALLIAKRQPAARDMRTIMATMRSMFDLERVGDEITKIARSVLAVSEELSMPKGASQVERLGKDVASMFVQALDAVTRSDVSTVLEIARKDRDVDQHCNNIMLTLAQSMEQNPEQIASCINLLWIVRSLERIGDHSCNLTEHVVYGVHGTDVRHKHKLSDLEESIGK